MWLQKRSVNEIKDKVLSPIITLQEKLKVKIKYKIYVDMYMSFTWYKYMLQKLLKLVN